MCVCVTEAVPVCPQEAIPSKSTLSPSGPCPSCGFSTPEVASPSKPIPGVASLYEPPGSGAGAEEGSHMGRKPRPWSRISFRWKEESG